MYDAEFAYGEEDREVTRLSPEEWDRLMAALEAEPKPIPELVKILKKKED